MPRLALTERRGPVTERLPCNVDVERLVLGSILLDDARYPAAASVLSAEDFILEKHRRIWRRMQDLYSRGERIDRITIQNELLNHGELESCDSNAYLVSLDAGLPAVLQLDSYFRILIEKTARRRIMRTCLDLYERCSVSGEEIQQIAVSGLDILAKIGERQGLQFRSINEIPSITECGGEIEYIRDPELPKGAVVALTGDSASGKSTLLTAWARDAWLKQGIPTLFLDRENPRAVVAERMERLGMRDGPGLHWWGGWLDQEAPQPDAQIVVDWVKLCDPRPIVAVDSLSGFHVGDQNDAGEMRAFVHRCRRLANLGATVIIVHHDGKAESAKDYRGSSDFKAAVDVAFHVSNFASGGRLDKLLLRTYKHRFGFSGDLSYQYAGGQLVRAESAETNQTISEQLTAVLRLNPGANRKRFEELAAVRGIGRNQARAFLDAGVLSSGIRRERGPNNTKRHFLAATDAQGEL